MFNGKIYFEVYVKHFATGIVLNFDYIDNRGRQ